MIYFKQLINITSRLKIKISKKLKPRKYLKYNILIFELKNREVNIELRNKDV